jgi:23S rRNA (cytosine1962-C5)-methyltransferase
MSESATVTQRGAQRWARGHPWIFKSDVRKRPAAPAGTVRVRDDRGRWLGVALWSPLSEISLRRLDPDSDAVIDAAWWEAQLARSIARRGDLGDVTTAYRLVHAEGDGLPSLICDRYDRWLVVQVLSAGLEVFRQEIVAALVRLTGAEGVLARNDVPLRSREGLARETVLLHGDVPREIVVVEHGIRYAAAPWTGQKTGAFLDQRENRRLMGRLAGGRALDCFSYHGSFALHLARNATEVVAVDSSAEALQRAAANADLNGISNVNRVEANVFDYLRDRDRARESFDTIVLDPPAFAKTRDALEAALRGYHEINLRAMRLLAPGGTLFTASCSHHLTRALFLEMVVRAAEDSGRRLVLREITGQAIDHPEVVTIPETGYLKGVILQAEY